LSARTISRFSARPTIPPYPHVTWRSEPLLEDARQHGGGGQRVRVRVVVGEHQPAAVLLGGVTGPLPGLLGEAVAQQQDVQVAVAGVAETDRGQTLAARRRPGRPHQVGEARSRYHRVAFTVGAAVHHGVADLAPDGPQPPLVAGLLGHLHLAGAEGLGQLAELDGHLEQALGVVTVELEEQHDLLFEQPGRHRHHPVNGVDPVPLDQLAGRHRAAPPTERLDRRGGFFERAEGEEQAEAGPRQGRELEHRGCDDAEGALGADEQLRQVVAGDVLAVAPAGPEQAAVGERHLEGENVLARRTVQQRPGAGGVFGEVAAEKAHVAARGIGRIEQPLGLDRLVQGGGPHPGLGLGDHVCGVDGPDAVEAFDRQHQPALGCQRAPRETAAAAAGGDRNVGRAGRCQDQSDLFGAARSHHRFRREDQLFGRVDRVGSDCLRRREHVVAAHQLGEARQQGGVDGGKARHPRDHSAGWRGFGAGGSSRQAPAWAGVISRPAGSRGWPQRAEE
jgi:hypothetical protein